MSVHIVSDSDKTRFQAELDRLDEEGYAIIPETFRLTVINGWPCYTVLMEA